MKYILDNKEWIFSGIGIAGVTFLFALVKWIHKKNNMRIRSEISQHQQNIGSIQSQGDVKITNNFYRTLEEGNIGTSHTNGKITNFIPSGSNVFMIKILTTKNNWLDNIMSVPREIAVYEHNSKPNKFKDICAGDYVCIYDESSKIHLTGIVTVHKYFSVNDILRHNPNKTNIGFRDKSELVEFISQRKDTNKSVLCTVFKVENRFNDPITFKEFEWEFGVVIPVLDYPIKKIVV